MKYAHLPVAGGLYDQSPKLLDDFHYIMLKEGEAQKREMAEQERKNRKPQGGGMGRGRGRRRK
jgi:hypothetical protein